MIRIKYLALALMATTLSLSAEQVEHSVVVGKYNTFVFDKPYKSILFEGKSPVEKPKALTGNTGFLIKIKEKTEAPFQGVIELVNGETVEFILSTVDGTKGSVYRRNGAGVYAAPEGQRARPSDLWVVDTMRSAVLGEIPSGFSEEGVGKPGSIGAATLTPIKRYSNYEYELNIYSLSSEIPTTIQPIDFWHEGVEAVQVEGDIVSPNENPTVFILRSVR